ncbi:hypothetical protein MKEN_01478000 [Mycena kentingensis (nom. inval.)]|nr:hypothetical protein MKEN_01478000 [Mycena kentingensis (nom. inval.)]
MSRTPSPECTSPTCNDKLSVLRDEIAALSAQLETVQDSPLIPKPKKMPRNAEELQAAVGLANDAKRFENLQYLTIAALDHHTNIFDPIQDCDRRNIISTLLRTIPFFSHFERGWPAACFMDVFSEGIIRIVVEARASEIRRRVLDVKKGGWKFGDSALDDEMMATTNGQRVNTKQKPREEHHSDHDVPDVSLDSEANTDLINAIFGSTQPSGKNSKDAVDDSESDDDDASTTFPLRPISQSHSHSEHNQCSSDSEDGMDVDIAFGEALAASRSALIEDVLDGEGDLVESAQIVQDIIREGEDESQKRKATSPAPQEPPERRYPLRQRQPPKPAPALPAPQKANAKSKVPAKERKGILPVAQMTNCSRCNSALALASLGKYPIPSTASVVCPNCIPEPPLVNENSLSAYFSRVPGSLVVVPRTSSYTDESPWFPAIVQDYNPQRVGCEYRLKWFSAAVWERDEDGVITEPSPAGFFRSAAEFAGYPRWLDEDQLPQVNLPQTLQSSVAWSINDRVTRIGRLAIPGIIDILNDSSSQHAVVRNYHTFHRDKVINDNDQPWLASIGFTMSYGAIQAFDKPLDDLRRNKQLMIKAGRRRRNESIACVILQCLGMQDTLGETWDLAHHTFLEWLAGDLVIDPAIERAQAVFRLMRDVSGGGDDFADAHITYEGNNAVKPVVRVRARQTQAQPTLITSNTVTLRTHEDFSRLDAVLAKKERKKPVAEYGRVIADN